MEELEELIEELISIIYIAEGYISRLECEEQLNVYVDRKPYCPLLLDFCRTDCVCFVSPQIVSFNQIKHGISRIFTTANYLFKGSSCKCFIITGTEW